MIEFDRGGTDVVLYQYDDADLRQRVEPTGAEVSIGAFSDISFLDSPVKCLNWGVGYQDYHGPRSHAWLRDTFLMVGYYLDFHVQNFEQRLPHDNSAGSDWWGARSSTRSYSFADDESWAPIYETDDEGNIVYELFDCEAWEPVEGDEEVCSGTVQDSSYGLLCETHRRVYLR